MGADDEPLDEIDAGVVALQARFEPPVEIVDDQIATRPTRGEDQPGDLGTASVAARRDDAEDRVGIGGAGDDDDADAAAIGVEQDGGRVVAERSGECEHGQGVGSRPDRVDASAGHEVGGAVARHGVPFLLIVREGGVGAGDTTEGV